jgi:hypothetical protein
MFNVRGSLSSVSDVVQSSSFKARVSFSIVEVTLSRIYSTICLGISESIFLIEAVSMAIVPSLVKVEGMVSII